CAIVLLFIPPPSAPAPYPLSLHDALPISVTARVPIRTNRDDRYFTDTYQVMPLHGYTRMFEKMLAHPNIKILLNTDYREIEGVRSEEHTSELQSRGHLVCRRLLEKKQPCR